MKKLLLIIVLFCGCTHKSELKHESGIVVEKQFSAEFNGSGTGIGMTTGGNLAITSNEIHKSEQFMVVFKCEHKTVFSVNKKDLYYGLEKGDSVNIFYYEILNADNKVVDTQFINAYKK